MVVTLLVQTLNKQKLPSYFEIRVTDRPAVSLSLDKNVKKLNKKWTLLQMKAQTKRQFLFFLPCVFMRGNKMQENDAIDRNADTIKGIGLYPSCICKKKGRVACCQTPQLWKNKRKVISNLISALFFCPFVLCQLKYTKYHTEKSHISLSHLLLEFMDTLSLHLKSALGAHTYEQNFWFSLSFWPKKPKRGLWLVLAEGNTAHCFLKPRRNLHHTEGHFSTIFVR